MGRPTERPALMPAERLRSVSEYGFFGFLILKKSHGKTPGLVKLSRVTPGPRQRWFIALTRSLGHISCSEGTCSAKAAFNSDGLEGIEFPVLEDLKARVA